MTTALQFIAQVAALSASGDGRQDNDEAGIDHGFEHDTGDSLDALDQIIHGARKLLGQPHDDRAHVFVDTNAAPVTGTIPDAVDLKSAMQWLLDDMHDAGETHNENDTPFDSVESAARALLNAGGVLNWYDTATRIPVVDGDEGADVYGYASSAEEAKMVAAPQFADGVCRIEQYGPINLRNGATLPTAFVAISGAHPSAG